MPSVDDYVAAALRYEEAAQAVRDAGSRPVSEFGPSVMWGGRFSAEVGDFVAETWSRCGVDGASLVGLAAECRRRAGLLAEADARWQAYDRLFAQYEQRVKAYNAGTTSTKPTPPPKPPGMPSWGDSSSSSAAVPSRTVPSAASVPTTTPTTPSTITTWLPATGGGTWVSTPPIGATSATSPTAPRTVGGLPSESVTPAIPQREIEWGAPLPPLTTVGATGTALSATQRYKFLGGYVPQLGPKFDCTPSGWKPQSATIPRPPSTGVGIGCITRPQPVPNIRPVISAGSGGRCGFSGTTRVPSPGVSVPIRYVCGVGRPGWDLPKPVVVQAPSSSGWNITPTRTLPALTIQRAPSGNFCGVR